MGLPHTLGGILGFVIAVMFVIGMSAPTIYPDESESIKKSNIQLSNSLNASMNTSQSSSGLISSLLSIGSFFQFISDFLVLMVQYVLLFVGISLKLPTEFYLFFALIIVCSIVAIVKLIFGAGD